MAVVGLELLEKFSKRIAYKIRRKLNYKTISISGIVLNTDPDFVPKGIRKLLLQKNYESPELALVREGLTAQDRVLEVGAGIGFVGIACAKICGPENILSYEPNPKMKPVIEANYALNGMRPNLRSKVVATTAGKLEFYFSDSVLSSSLVDRNQGSPTLVEADAISSVIENFRPSAIVMDAEGAEIGLLPACDLSNVSTIAVEMHPHIVGAPAISELRTYLRELGFMEKKTLGKSALFQKAS
ncbi:MAG: FkbM family methyltransferase [Stappiaceae bacterium]